MWKPSSDTYCRKRSTRPTRLILDKKEERGVSKHKPKSVSDRPFKFSAPLYWTLTLTNMLQRCAPDTDRCTGAGEKSPPEKTNKQKKNNLLFAKVLVFSILEFFLPLLTLCVSSRIFCFYTISALFKYAQAYLVTFQYSSSSQGLIY